MIVMKEHDWFDDDVETVTEEYLQSIDGKVLCIHIGLEAINISKYDVIALAKEFNLIVFKKESQL